MMRPKRAARRLCQLDLCELPYRGVHFLGDFETFCGGTGRGGRNRAVFGREIILFVPEKNSFVPEIKDFGQNDSCPGQR